jgi:hypothetical protein
VKGNTDHPVIVIEPHDTEESAKVVFSAEAFPELPIQHLSRSNLQTELKLLLRFTVLWFLSI